MLAKYLTARMDDVAFSTLAAAESQGVANEQVRWGRRLTGAREGREMAACSIRQWKARARRAT